MAQSSSAAVPVTVTSIVYTLQTTTSIYGPRPTTVTSWSTAAWPYHGQVNEEFYKNVTAVLLPNCKNLVDVGLPLETANPDISGFGVILSFVISAYLVLALAIFAYCFGLLPSHLLGHADRKCFFADSRRASPRTINAIEKITLIFSDQQIITGISILIAGYAHLFPAFTEKPLSAYHWQTLTYLAWMSSNVHLATLSLLRGWLQQNKMLMRCRLFGMTCLFVLMLAALVPTVSRSWAATVQPYPDTLSTALDRIGTPAYCFWSHGQGLNANAPVSYTFLIGSYIWKLVQLHHSTRLKVRTWFREIPQRGLEKLCITALGSAPQQSMHRRVAFRFVAIVYVPFVAICELLESFAASLWLISLGLTWASLQLFLPRMRISSTIRLRESIWSFGQILPLLLLLQPAAAIFEHVFGTPSKRCQCQFSIDDFAMDTIRQDLQPDTPEQRVYKTLSEVLLEETSHVLPKRTPSDGPAPQIKFLYTSRCFKSLLWTMQILIFMFAVVVFYFSASYPWFADAGSVIPSHLSAAAAMETFAFFMDGGLANTLAACCYGFVLILLHVLCVSLFSKAFR